MNVKLSIVVPVYAEEGTIRPFLKRVEKVLHTLALSYEIIFVLDPSPDQTEAVILDEIKRNRCIKLIVLSRRFGQPAATMAGICGSEGEAVVVMDVDLQDPPEVIPTLYRTLQEGYDVVYAKRRGRQGETWLKTLTAKVGYYLINRLSDIPIPRDTGDFRIISRRVIEELKKLNEAHAFLKGLVAFVGFKQTAVLYEREARHQGKGKYNPWFGSLKIGFNGLIGFSTKPLQIMSLLGLFIAGGSFLLGLWYVVQKLLGFPLTPGLSTMVLVVSFFSGVQLVALGLMGEYVGRIYDEVKRRPLYIVDRTVNCALQEDNHQGRCNVGEC